jgi:hypothetical protein
MKRDCAGCTCAGEHVFSLDSRHGPKPEWNVDCSFTYRASSPQSFLHVTVNQTFHTSSPTDTTSSSVEPGHFVREQKVVTWKAALSMNQLLLCGHGEEVKVMLVDTEGRPSRASVNFVIYPTGRLEEDGVDGSTGAVGTSAGDFSGTLIGRSVKVVTVEARDSVGGVFSILEEREEIEGNDEAEKAAAAKRNKEEAQAVEAKKKEEEVKAAEAKTKEETRAADAKRKEEVLSEHRLSHLMDDSASGRDTSTPAGTGVVDHGRTYSVGALIVTDEASPHAGGERKQSNWLAEGTLAVIEGISNKPHYNGLHVMVQARLKDDDKHNDQYTCTLLHPNEAQAVSVKPNLVVRGLNLRVLDSQDMTHVSQDSRTAGKRPKEREKERQKEVPPLRRDDDLSTYLPGERVSSRPSSSTKSSAYAPRVIGVTKVRHLCAMVGWV